MMWAISIVFAFIKASRITLHIIYLLIEVYLIWINISMFPTHFVHVGMHAYSIRFAIFQKIGLMWYGCTVPTECHFNKSIRIFWFFELLLFSRSFHTQIYQYWQFGDVYNLFGLQSKKKFYSPSAVDGSTIDQWIELGNEIIYNKMIGTLYHWKLTAMVVLFPTWNLRYIFYERFFLFLFLFIAIHDLHWRK